MLKTINTSVFLAALNMSLPEARSFTLHYAGPQEASFMLIRQLPFRRPWPSSAASTAKVPEIEPRILRFRPQEEFRLVRPVVKDGKEEAEYKML